MNEFKISNFLKELNNINSFANRIKYADNNLTRIGGGSGRIVYELNDTKVLKLAKNQKGVAQNNVEFDLGKNYDFKDIITMVFEFSDDYTWIISEKAKKVTEKRIKELTGIPNLWLLSQYLVNKELENENKKRIYKIDQSDIDKLSNNDFVIDLTNLMYCFGIGLGDTNRPSTFGEVMRNGKPKIVMVDYGLNKEVYDTHYSPNRKQKIKMYELYNFNDGNDDILSDDNGTNDIKYSNWALIPQDIGSGNGEINERFISFVENRNEYPNKPVSNIGVLCDEFYNCINNLNETLDSVKNKKQFFEKFLKLQEYLISQNCYNRDKIELHEEYDFKNVKLDNIPPVKKFSIKDENYAKEIVSEVGKKLGFTIVKSLKGGSYGYAFIISDGNVFKLTTDVGEADGASILRRNNPKNIVWVYNVYKIVDTENNMSFYGIIEENIENKPKEIFYSYYRAIDKIKPNNMSTADFLIKMKKRNFDYNDMNEIKNLLGGILNQNKEADIPIETRKAAYNYMMGILLIKKELMDLGIKSNDYGNPENIGYDENGVLKFFDFGDYRADEPNLEKFLILLPENENVINETYDINLANRIANQVVNKLNLKNLKYIDGGNFGVAYEVNNNMILKITKDRSEAVENFNLIGKNLERIAKPYNVYEIKSKTEKIPETYAILLEKLKVTSEIERKYNRLNYVFSKLFNVDVSEVVEEYLGFNSGWIRKIDIYNYFKKNPEDVDFFREITEIAKECHELGISSLDFYNWKNLGYKKDGKLGFFDIGFGDGFLVPNNLQNIEIDEVFGGSSLYSTTNTVSDDNKPTYNQIDSSDPIDNNIIRNTNELSERQISAMKDSSSVEVKKKCKLGGLGNKSIACNQGDINNLIIKPIEEIFYRFSNNINEEIDASEAYDVEGAIMTIINGKRNVGLVSFHKNQNLKNFVINSGLNIIPVKQEQQNANTSIIYCDGYEKQANMLHDIMKSHGGYLSDKTPKEAYIIGRLLGYTNDSILRYIYKKYPHIRKDYSQRYSGSTMNENLTDSKILVPIRDHVGWITPDGKFIEGGHLQVMLNIYRIKYKNNYDFDETKKIYDMAINDGYTRIVFNSGGSLGDILDIQTLNKKRFREIILGGYVNTIKKPESQIYCDIGNSEHNNYYVFKMDENKEDLYFFLFSNKSIRNIHESMKESNLNIIKNIQEAKLLSIN